MRPKNGLHNLFSGRCLLITCLKMFLKKPTQVAHENEDATKNSCRKWPKGAYDQIYHSKAMKFSDIF